MPLEPQTCGLIVLAAGLSHRFGDEDKLLADLGGKQVIEHVMLTGSKLNFAHACIVSSDSYSEVSKISQQYGFHVIVNPTPEAGQGYSLALGASHILETGLSSACVLLADMPLVKPNHINALMKECDVSKSMLSRCNGVLMPPAILSRDALIWARSHSGDKGMKALFAGRNVEALPLSEIDACDMDTPEDLDKLRNSINAP